MLELNVKSYCAEAAHQRKHGKRTDKTGDANEADPTMADYEFGRDRRLQAISEACFSLAPTQTDQIADSASVVLPDGVHNNTDTFGEIYFGIDKPKHAKQKDVKLMTKDPALRTRKRNF